VCGGDEKADLAAFVEGKDGGERVVEMFERAGATACLDYREREPNWVQVKIGACQHHLPALERLYDLTRFVRCITPEVIAEALRWARKESAA
jgi:hypothetical protein